MIIKCPAKVNLYLNTKYKNSDGFHEIESIFHTVGLNDYISIKSADSFSFKFSPKSTIPITNGNYDLTKGNFIELVYNMLKVEFSLPPVEIEIEKHIPVGAGLGGGSSDTTGCLLGLNNFFNLKLSKNKLFDIAKSFGSDTSFFLSGGMAFVSGRGEIIESSLISLNSSVVIVYPDITISTKLAYQKYNTLFDTKNNKLLDIPDYNELKKQIIYISKNNNLSLNIKRKEIEKILNISKYNSFQAKTIIKYKEINQIYEILSNFHTSALLSGSGSSIFTSYHDMITSKKIVYALKDRYPNSFITNFISNGVEIIRT